MSASPQLEDGHIKVANELFDAMLRYPFTARQMKVVLAVMRKTYGFNKKRDDVSASQIATLCGLQRNHVTTTLIELACMNVIFKVAGEYGSMVEINKNYQVWGSPDLGHPLVPKQDTPLSQFGTRGEISKPLIPLEGCPELGLVDENVASPNLGQVDSPNLGHTKDNLPKDIKHSRAKEPEVIDENFEEMWRLYPKREGGNSKSAALKAWNARLKSGVKPESMIEGVKRYAKQVRDAGNEGSRYVKMASTFLGPDQHFTADLATPIEKDGGEYWQQAGFGKEWEAVSAGVTESNAKFWKNQRPTRKLAGVVIEPWEHA